MPKLYSNQFIELFSTLIRTELSKDLISLLQLMQSPGSNVIISFVPNFIILAYSKPFSSSLQATKRLQ